MLSYQVGKQYVDSAGNKVTILTTTRKHKKYPIVALVHTHGGVEKDFYDYVQTYSVDGEPLKDSCCPYPLEPLQQEIEFAVNIYENLDGIAVIGAGTFRDAAEAYRYREQSKIGKWLESRTIKLVVK